MSVATGAHYVSSTTNPLSAQQRCDRCGAQAYAEAVFTAGTLAFCAHHFVQHLPALKAQARQIFDYTTATTSD